MAQINLDIPDDIIQAITQNGQDPTQFFQERLLALSTSQVNEPDHIQKFQSLANQWRKETRHLSLMSDIVLNTAYQQIIGMGALAIPLILKELKEQPDHWFWALRSIVGESPIPSADRGRLHKMTEAWLAWGRKHGYQC